MVWVHFTPYIERLKTKIFMFIHRTREVKIVKINRDDFFSSLFFIFKTVMFSAVTIERKDTLKKKKKLLGLNFWLS